MLHKIFLGRMPGREGVFWAEYEGYEDPLEVVMDKWHDDNPNIEVLERIVNVTHGLSKAGAEYFVMTILVVYKLKDQEDDG